LAAQDIVDGAAPLPPSSEQGAVVLSQTKKFGPTVVSLA